MFSSFFQGGFECATGFNIHREWIDQIQATRHDRLVDDDYLLLKRQGITTVREGVRWPLIDNEGAFNFSSLDPFLRAARAQQLDVIWDLFHFGYPREVDPFSNTFLARFTEYCYRVGRHIALHFDRPIYFTPINEASYFSFVAGERGIFAPYAQGRGYELKVALARAAISGIEALWSACPRARIVNVDPLCRVAEPRDRPELKAEVEDFNSRVVFQTWDMIAGLALPELGGSLRHLDIVGINYYWTNQWEHGSEGCVIHEGDPRHVPLSVLVRDVWQRYRCNILITETGHLDEMRPAWILKVTTEILELLREGLPIHGICLYPILGMPEWHNRGHWTHFGLWDLSHADGSFNRTPYLPALHALDHARYLLRDRAQSSKTPGN